MLTAILGAKDYRDLFLRLLLAFVAGWAAIYVYASLLALFASARFWESWAASGSWLPTWAPVLVIAFVSGLALGVALASVTRPHALRVAAAAAVLQFVQALFLGSILSSAMLGAGLIAGAAVVGAFRRA